VAISCEHGNEPLGSKKFGEFLDTLSDYKLLKKVSITWSLFIVSLVVPFRISKQ